MAFYSYYTMNDLVNTIICADCLDILRAMPDKSVDLILTDPPYGISRHSGHRGEGGFRSGHNLKGGNKPIPRRFYEGGWAWDTVRPDKVYFDEIIRLGKKIMIFGGNYFADMLPYSPHWIVWDKLNTMPSFSDCELIWTNLPKLSVKKITYQYNGMMIDNRHDKQSEPRTHPTQKPERLTETLIQMASKIGDMVLDPFCGSGTTCVAAKKLQRNYIGIDIDPRYVEMTNQRLIAIDAIQLEFV